MSLVSFIRFLFELVQVYLDATSVASIQGNQEGEGQNISFKIKGWGVISFSISFGGSVKNVKEPKPVYLSQTEVIFFYRKFSEIL
jgi:hypothetical protein